MSTLKFDPDSPSIIVSVKLQGIYPETATLIIDTGASYVMIPWRLATAINLNVDPNKTIPITSATTIEIVPIVTIPEIEFLGKKVKFVKAVIKDLPPTSPAEGLLGLSFLRHFKLTVDFKKGNLSLE